MSNLDFNELMKMLSTMDKKELESRMNQVSNMLKNKTPEEILKDVSGNGNSNQK